MARVKSTGLVLALPASMKLMFISAPQKAAIPTSPPRMIPTPTSSSPQTISLANQVYHWWASM